jgi:hypothetical protein
MAKTITRPTSRPARLKEPRSGKVDLKLWGPGLRRPVPPPSLKDQAALQARATEEFRRIRQAIEEAKVALSQVADRFQFDPAQRIALLQMLLRQLQQAESSAPLPPARAPELWSEREGRKENPIAFIRRVYAPWLGKGLTRAQLGNLDQPLYRALSVWVHRHPEDEMPELPSLSQLIDEKIARLSDEFTPDELRKLGFAIQNRLRRM